MRPWAQSRGLLSCSCSFWESRASLYKMYLLIFDCAGSCGCTWPFSSCGVELPIAAASFLVEHSLWAWGLQPLVYGLRCSGAEGLTSLTRDGTHVPCIGRQILNHGTTREILGSLSVWFADGNIYGFFVRIFNIRLFKKSLRWWMPMFQALSWNHHWRVKEKEIRQIFLNVWPSSTLEWPRNSKACSVFQSVYVFLPLLEQTATNLVS